MCGFECLCGFGRGDSVDVCWVCVGIVEVVVKVLCCGLLIVVIYGVDDGLVFIDLISDCYVLFVCSVGVWIVYWWVNYV